MQLFYSPNSPYARKCRIVAIEKDLTARVAFVETDPWSNPAELVAANPLGMVPALIADDGLALCDSKVICEFLDSLSPTTPLYPAAPRDRFAMLSKAVMAEGMIDAAVSCVIENLRRPEERRWTVWVERKEAAIKRALALLAPTISSNTPLSIATITLGVALDYISFRMPHIHWRKEHPQLVAWYEGVSLRPSFIATAPR